MKTLLLLLVALVSLIISSTSAQTSGTIYFEDGGTQRFFDLDYISGTLENGESMRDAGYDSNFREIYLIYNNSVRNIELSTLDYIEIKSYDTQEYYNGIGLVEIIIEVKTKTGIKFTNKLKRLDDLEGVIIFDELSGKQTKIDQLHFLLDGRLAIRKIIFD